MSPPPRVSHARFTRAPCRRARSPPALGGWHRPIYATKISSSRDCRMAGPGEVAPHMFYRFTIEDPYLYAPRHFSNSIFSESKLAACTPDLELARSRPTRHTSAENSPPKAGRVSCVRIGRDGSSEVARYIGGGTCWCGGPGATDSTVCPALSGPQRRWPPSYPESIDQVSHLLTTRGGDAEDIPLVSACVRAALDLPAFVPPHAAQGARV